MAKVNLFTAARIAMEEEDIGTSSSVSNDVAQNEVENIEAQNEVEEVAKISSEIEQVASQIEEGIDEGEKLDEAIVEGEEVLENNEGGDVPEEAVEVAQEALSESILLLAGREGKKQFKPSLESYETNIQKLRVSLEAAKDFANNIWQKIKELFAKFVTMIKKYVVKLGAMFDKGAKQADALKKVFEQRTVFDNEKVNDEFKDKLAKAYPAGVKVIGLGYIINGRDLPAVENILDNVEKDTGTLASLANFFKKIIKNKSSEEKAETYLTNSKVELGFKDDEGDGSEALYLALVKRNSVWYIGTQGTTGSEKVEVDGDDVGTVTDIGSAKLVNCANTIKTYANGYKSRVNKAFSLLDKKTKEIDKLRDADVKGALDYEEKARARKLANISYKLTTQCAFQILSSSIDHFSGILAILGVFSSAYKKA